MPTIAESFPGYNLTGAIHHYVRTVSDFLDSAQTIYYLGTCEVQPDIRIWNLTSEVKNDRAGRILPGQKIDQGKKADIGLQLSYYSELTYQNKLLQPRGNAEVNGLVIADQPGWDGRFALGSLVFGSKTFELWQVFERQTIAAFRDELQPIGYYWPQVELMQHGPVTLGNQEKQLLLILEAQPYLVPQASFNAVGARELSRQLWLQDDASFPPQVRVPQ